MRATNPLTRSDNLLLRFRDQDTPTSISRESLRAMSAKLGLSETATVQLALRVLHNQTFPLTEAESGSGIGEAAEERQAREPVPTVALLSNSLFGPTKSGSLEGGGLGADSSGRKLRA